MYHAVYLMIAAAICGVFVVLLRGKRIALLAPIAIYWWFWCGQLYNVLLLYLSKGAATSMGWYMYSVVSAEVLLFVTGLRALVRSTVRTWIAPCVVLVAAVLDLYTVHFISIPYYTGKTFHRISGAFPAFHLDQLSNGGAVQMLERLCVNKPFWLMPATMCGFWLLYLVATAVSVWLAWQSAVRGAQVQRTDPGRMRSMSVS
jgi:hypothetical protein